VIKEKTPQAPEKKVRAPSGRKGKQPLYQFPIFIMDFITIVNGPPPSPIHVDSPDTSSVQIEISRGSSRGLIWSHISLGCIFTANFCNVSGRSGLPKR